MKASPPEHELPFACSGRNFVALLWCLPLDVWDTIVFEIPKIQDGEEFLWQCSGVALKRFVPVQGKCSARLAGAISEAIRSGI